MQPKIKECPNCGEEIDLHGYGLQFEIECGDCQLRMRGDDKEELIKRWNKRVFIFH